MKDHYERKIYGFGNFDWSQAFGGSARFPVEIQTKFRDPVGLIDLSIEIDPPICYQDVADNFLQAEGKRATHITPLFVRDLPTPFHAFNFLQMFTISDLHTDDLPAYNFSLHCVLASRSGSLTEVNLLLCSFLCGFGYEAFICGDNVITIHTNHCIIYDLLNGKRSRSASILPSKLIGFRSIYEPVHESPSLNIHDPRDWRKLELPLPITTPGFVLSEKN